MMKRRRFIQSALLAPLLSIEAIGRATTVNDDTGSEVINSGIGGNNSIDLLERIDKDCLAHRPGLTILMIGTNDMNSRKFVPIDAFEKNLKKIISMIKKIRSHILLMNLLPVYEPYVLTRHKPEFYNPEGHSGRLQQMNELIKKTAKTNHLSFIDLYHLFKSVGNVGLEANSLIKNEANSNTTDGLHPTPDGYRVIGIAVYEHIINTKLPLKKIVCFGDSITFGDGKVDGANYPSYLKKLLS